MYKLIIKELPESDNQRIAAEMLQSTKQKNDWEKSIVDEAGHHRVVYNHIYEVRCGDAYYSARIEGMYGDRITERLRGQKIYCRCRAYHSSRNWYAFEVLNDTRGGVCSIWVFDLSSGDLRFTFNEGSRLPIAFTSWVADSSSFVFTHHEQSPDWSWHKLDIASGATRHLFTGGSGTPLLTSDGRFLLIPDSARCSLSLISVETGELLDRIVREDFGSLLNSSKSFHPVSFDAVKPQIVAILNLWEHSCDAVRFDGAVSIEIAL
jgi:hypothetical protein